MTAIGAILVVNAGYSSLKFQVFATDGTKELRRLVKGQTEGVGTRPRLRAEDMHQKPLVDRSYAATEVADLPAAIEAAVAWLRDSHSGDPIAVGHHVVHGGPEYHEPVIVDPEVLARLEHYVSLAPLHQANNLAPIRALLERRPDLPQVACFDTAFHRRHGALAGRFAIPGRLHREGVRRGIPCAPCRAGDHLRQ